MIFAIRITGYREFSLSIEPYYSVLTVKKKIKSLFDIPRSQQSLFHNYRELQNSSILSEIGIGHGAVLTLQVKNDTFYIYCLVWPGIIKPIYVQPSDTIENLREIVEKETPPHYPTIHSIELNGRTLENARYVSDYEIKLGSLLNVIANLDYTKDVQE